MGKTWGSHFSSNLLALKKVLGFAFGFSLFLCLVLFDSKDAHSSTVDLDSLYGIQKTDPYLIASENKKKPNYRLNLEVISHGVERYWKDFLTQVKAAELILSQCDGIQLDIQIQKKTRTKKYKFNKEFIEFKKIGEIWLTGEFFKFFKKWMPEDDRDIGKRIQVHLVDFLSSKSRLEARKTKRLTQYNLGRAYSARVIESIYQYSLPKSLRQMNLNGIAGNSLFLAMETTKVKSNQIRRTALGENSTRLEIKERNISTLAHEIGHILLQPELSSEFYYDHYCPEFNDFCSWGYLMSTGGNSDAVFYSGDSVYGYGKMPKIDKVQCETLRTHPLIEKI